MVDGTPPGTPAPLPRWVVWTFVLLIAVTLACGALAVWLGTSTREQEAAQSQKRVVAATTSVPADMPDLSGPTEMPPLAENAALEAGMEEIVPVVSPSAPVAAVSASAPDSGMPVPLWKLNAVSVDVPAGAPKLALIIDDMGGIMDTSRRAATELPVGVTLSFFPWSREGVELAHDARDAGHEILIHMPMEALPHGSTTLDPGPRTLRVDMDGAEVEALTTANVASLKDIAVGVNNHMGSRFTEWLPGMRGVLEVLQREGLMFVDSKTAAPTAVKAAAQGLALPVLTRDVFLDHEPNPVDVKAELARAVALAKKRGSAIAIGHPLPVTLDVLAAELPAIVSSGVVLVPVTQLIGRE